ncbi:annexin A9 [Sceloporus undulatus]|uniref:annexin A9 n=1 Tax=Sceloporus undulatus TaxID=8520 RepID=UPI001C4CFF6F|nr:annexin A9 [Sceloporus undulatus]
MSPVKGPEKPSMADEILKQLPLVEKTAVWGTLGTIRPHLSFDVEKDVQTLLEAVSGEGVHYGTIIDLLTSRSDDQRQQISEEFLAFTKQDLLKTLEAAVSGNLEALVVGLLKPMAQFDAHEVKAALEGSEAETLVEILSTRTKEQLREIMDFYEHDFKSELEADIVSGTSGVLKDLLVALIQGSREKYSRIIDYILIKQDTKALLEDDSGEVGRPKESEWVRILTQRSPEHLNRVFNWYHEQTGLQIEDTVDKYFQGGDGEALLTLVSLIRNTPLYFATKLYQAIKGPGANLRTLARIMISRSETDLLSIRAELRKHYDVSLYSLIWDETKGNYRAALLGLCRAEDL